MLKKFFPGKVMAEARNLGPYIKKGRILEKDWVKTKQNFIFLILNGPNREQFVLNNNSHNIFDGNSLCIREMNDSDDTRNGKEEGIFCRYHIAVLPRKRCSAVWKWTEL